MSATPPPTAAQNSVYLMPRADWLSRRNELIHLLLSRGRDLDRHNIIILG